MPPADQLPDRAAMAAIALSQGSSPFFRLPLELRRRVYADLCGTGIHIFRHEGRLTHAPCLLSDPESAIDGINEVVDTRQVACVESALYSDNSGRTIARPGAQWVQRMRSSWACHWECEESMLERREDAAAADGRRSAVGTPFMATLLVCRQMYLEASESIPESVPFIFTDLLTACAVIGGKEHDHPERTPPPRWLQRVQRIHIVSQTDRDACETNSPMLKKYIGIPDTPKGSTWPTLDLYWPWMDLLDGLLKLQRLKFATLWLDMSKPKPWTTSVWEFACLLPMLEIGGDFEDTEVGFTVNVPWVVEHAVRPPSDGELPPQVTFRRHTRSRFWVRGGESDDTVAEWFEDMEFKPDGSERVPSAWEEAEEAEDDDEDFCCWLPFD